MNQAVNKRDYVIIGGGLMGAAAAMQLAQLLKNDQTDFTITLLERGKKDLPTGSSAGDTRITRKVSYENPEVIPGMVALSNAILYQLGAVEPVPTILVGNNPKYFDNAITAAVKSDARYSVLNEQTVQQIPYVNMQGSTGIYEDAMDETGNGAGVINPPLAIRKMLEKAEQAGVVVRFETAVASINENIGSKIAVTLESGEIIQADKVISAAGVWSDKLIGRPTSGSLYTRPKVLKVFWFKLSDGHNLGDFPNILFKMKGGAEFSAQHPKFATQHPDYDFTKPSTEEGIYMIQEELADGIYLKFGHIQPVPKIKEDPDVAFARETISESHEAFIVNFLKEFMPGVINFMPDIALNRASFTKTYLDGFANDFMPIIGPRSKKSNVIVMTGFSGIGAKFAVAAGTYAAYYALNQPELIPEKARQLFAPDRKELRSKTPATLKVNGNLGAPGPDDTVQTPPCIDLGLLGKKAADLYRNGYPANPGIPEARAAVANMFNRFQTSKNMPGDVLSPNNVYLATGGVTDANQIAIEHAKSKFQSHNNPRALLLTPAYHLYVGQLDLNKFDIDYTDGADSYDEKSNSLTPQTDVEILANIRQGIKPDTCLLFINSPRNPDGKIYSRELLEGVLKILDDNPHLRIISDTVYKDVAPADQNVMTLYGLANPEQRQRIYETDGMSKSVGKTMDRGAWVLSDVKNIEEIAAVSHLLRGRPALPQMLQIISMDEYLVINAPNYGAKNSAMYLDKLKYVQAAASQVPGLKASTHLGAYYGYLDLRAVDFGLPMTALEKENAVVDALVTKGIAVSAGLIFNQPGAIRFNASFNNQTLQQLVGIIVDTFEELGVKVTRRPIPLPAIDTPDYDFQPYALGTISTQRLEVLNKLVANPVREFAQPRVTLTIERDMKTEEIRQDVESIFGEFGLSDKLQGSLVVTTPLTGENIGTIATNSAEDVGIMIENSIIAQERWKEDRELRVEFLQFFANRITENATDLAKLVHYDSGKSIKESLVEVNGVSGLINGTIKKASYDAQNGAELTKEFTPLGVVSIISPFNFELAIAMWTGLPALLAGNTVINKPSENASVAPVLFQHVLNQAITDFNTQKGEDLIPKNIYQVAIGEAEVGKALTADKRIAKVVVTGSIDVCEKVKKADREALRQAPAITEGGAANFVIISNKHEGLTRQQYLEFTVGAMLKSILPYAGQKCIGARQLIIHEDIIEDFAVELERQLDNFRNIWHIENAFTDQNPFEFTPLINARAGARFEWAKNEALQQGGEILGGERLGGNEYLHAHYYFPAVARFKKPVPLMQEEIFGPFVTIVPYSGGVNAALLIAQKPNARLVNAYYGSDKEEQRIFKRRNNAGFSIINAPGGTGLLPLYGLGFGGNGLSGQGESLPRDPEGPFVRADGDIRRNVTFQLQATAVPPRG